MKYIITGFALLSINILTHAQQEIPLNNTIKSNSISIGLIGAPGWPLGLSYGQMLTDRFSFEIGVGAYAAGAGVNIYLTNPRVHRVNLYTGLYGMINYDAYPMIYLPVGVSYIGKNNFQYGMDVGLMASENVSLTGNGGNFSPWFGLKVGRRFGEDIAVLKEAEKTTLKNIVSINLGGFDIFAGLVYERLITPYLGVEAGIGFLGAEVGSKFYFPSISKQHMSFHLGASQSWGAGFAMSGSTGMKTYFPVGINYLAKNNWRYSLDAGPQIWYEENNDILPSVSLRIGKAF